MLDERQRLPARRFVEAGHLGDDAVGDGEKDRPPKAGEEFRHLSDSGYRLSAIG